MAAQKFKIKDVLDKNLVAVEPQAKLMDVVLKMNSLKLGAAMVVDSTGNLKGIFTERDVLTKIIPSKINLETTAISEVMTKNVITINQNEIIDTALLIMNDKHIRNLPVVDDSGKPVGLISILTVIQAAMQSMVENFIEG